MRLVTSIALVRKLRDIKLLVQDHTDLESWPIAVPTPLHVPGTQREPHLENLDEGAERLKAFQWAMTIKAGWQGTCSLCACPQGPFPKSQRREGCSLSSPCPANLAVGSALTAQLPPISQHLLSSLHPCMLRGTLAGFLPSCTLPGHSNRIVLSGERCPGPREGHRLLISLPTAQQPSLRPRLVTPSCPAPQAGDET